MSLLLLVYSTEVLHLAFKRNINFTWFLTFALARFNETRSQATRVHIVYIEPVPADLRSSCGKAYASFAVRIEISVSNLNTCDGMPNITQRISRNMGSRTLVPSFSASGGAPMLLPSFLYSLVHTEDL